MPLHDSRSFSGAHLFFFALLFGLIAGYTIFHSFAANPNLPGDLNNDNIVNVLDLSILLSNYSTSNAAGDTNGDNLVNILDLSILLSNFGTTAPTQSNNPCTGVSIGTSTDLQQAINTNLSGTTFCIRAGVHRMTTYVIPKSNDNFIGDPGAILNGSKDVTSLFAPVGNNWVAAGQTQQNTLYGLCKSGRPCQYPDDVYFDNQPLQRVLSLSGLGPGKFYFDYNADQIYIADNPAGHNVEAAVASGAFHGFQTGADNVVIQGLVIEKFANSQFGALNARAWTIQNNEVRLNHGTGIQGGKIIRNNYVHNNGQLGIASFHSANQVVTGNEVSWNNYAGFGPGWEAGGIKFGVVTDETFSDNYVHDNDGPGIWCDTDCLRIVYSDNRVQNNSGPGIDHEVGYDATITGNTISGNGFAQVGTFQGPGILLQDSQNVNVYNNIISGNKQGIGMTQINRGSGAYGVFTTSGNQIHDNIIAMQNGNSGLVDWDNDPSVFTSKNNRFYHNTYSGCSSNTLPFIWKTNHSWSEWVAAGNDTNGSFSLTC